MKKGDVNEWGEYTNIYVYMNNNANLENYLFLMLDSFVYILS